MQDLETTIIKVDSLIDYSSQSNENEFNYGKGGGEKSGHENCKSCNGNSTKKPCLSCYGLHLMRIA